MTRRGTGRRYAVWAMFVITSLTVMDNIDGNSFYGVLPLIGKEFHLSDFALGLLPTAPTVMIVILTVPIAMAADRVARTRLIGVGVLVWSGCTALAMLAFNFVSLILLRALVGIGFASYDAPTNSLICDYFPPRIRGRAMSFQAFGQPLGAIVGVVVGGSLGQAIGWRPTFLVVAVPALVFGLLMLFGLQEPARGSVEGVDALALGRWTFGDVMQGAREILAVRGMLLGTVGRAVQQFGLAGIGTFFPTFMIRYYHQSNSVATGEFALVIVGALVGTLPSGFIDSWLHRRLGAGSRFVVAGVATTLAGMFFLLALLSPSETALIALAIASGVCLGANIAPLTTMVADVIAPERRSYAYAIQGLVATLLGLPAAPIVGAISDSIHNLRVALEIFTLPLILAGLLLLVMHRVQRRDAEAIHAGLASRGGPK